jgi:signal transduction histidine kinase
MHRVDTKALPDADRQHVLRLTYLYTAFSLGYYVTFAPVYIMYAHKYFLGFAHVMFAVLVAGLLVYLYMTKMPKVTSYGVCTLAALMVWYLAFDGGVAHTGMYFVLPVSILLFFLPNRRYSMMWIGAMLLSFGLAFLLAVGGLIVLPYSTENFALFMASFASSMGLLLIYAWEKDKLDRRLNRSIHEIRLLARSLEEAKELVEQKVQLRTQQYRKEHAKLEASIDSLRIGFIILDHELSVLSINDAGKKILISETDKSGIKSLPETMTMSEVVSYLGGAYDLVAKARDCMLHKRSVSARDVHFGSKYLAVTITPVLDGQTVAGAVVLLEDTTDSKALERSRDEFFSIASHELRTPLTSIVGNASMASQYYDRLDEKEVKGMLGDINVSGKRLIAIVNDFLEVSRIEQNNIKIKTEPVNCLKILHEVVNELKPSAQDKHLHLHVATSLPTSAAVLADHDRLRQILVNLINNAIKYTDAGEVKIAVTAAKHHKLIITVEDTGKGIPTDSQYLLFRKFQQASNNILTRDNSQSTGLGLYISKMLAKAMKGDVYLVRSTMGEGSVFAIALPAADDTHKE